MIWLILLIMALGIALLLISPLLRDSKTKLGLPLFMGGFIASTLGIYAVIGTPKAPEPEAPEMPQMTEIDIKAMVDGLAARLADDPEDPAGWTRLLRSRIVMNDFQALIRDHKTMSTQFAERPDIIADINAKSGFSELANSLAKPSED